MTSTKLINGVVMWCLAQSEHHVALQMLDVLVTLASVTGGGCEYVYLCLLCGNGVCIVLYEVRLFIPVCL